MIEIEIDIREIDKIIKFLTSWNIRNQREAINVYTKNIQPGRIQVHLQKIEINQKTFSKKVVIFHEDCYVYMDLAYLAMNTFAAMTN